MENQPTGGNNPENEQNRFDPDAYAYKSNKNIKRVYAAGRNVFGLTGDYDDWSQDDRERVARYCVEHEKADKTARNLKIGAAAVTVVAALNVIGLVGNAFKKKGEGAGSGTEGTTPVETSGSFGWENGGGETGNGQQGTGETNGSGAAETTGSTESSKETEANKEENEKYRFTDEHLYYFEEEKMETHKSTTGVTPESFARAERLVHDAYDSDLTPEEHALIEKGDKKAEGFEKAVQKLYAESIIRECTDSREVMGSWLLLRVKANPDSYPQFKGMTSQQIVDKLYEQDDETNKELLKKYEGDLLNAKYEETTLKGKWTTFKEVDIRDKNPDRMVQLEEYNITLENRTAVKITFADGSENYGFILAENVGWEIDTNTKTKELTVRDKKARKFKGCAQGAYKIGEPTPTPKPNNSGNPGGGGGGEPGKNAKAIIRNAGDHNTKLKVDGKASSKPAEGGKVNTTDKGGNPEGQKKANDDAEKNRKKAQENEKLSDAEAAKKFNFS